MFAARALLDDGTPDVEFTYDNHNRLTGFLNVFSPGAAPGSSFNWIKYSYTDDKSENPYIDSNFLFPFDVVNGSPTSYANLNTTNIQYDRDNRIIQDTTYTLSPLSCKDLMRGETPQSSPTSTARTATRKAASMTIR